MYLRKNGDHRLESFITVCLRNFEHFLISFSVTVKKTHRSQAMLCNQIIGSSIGSPSCISNRMVNFLVDVRSIEASTSFCSMNQENNLIAFFNLFDPLVPIHTTFQHPQAFEKGSANFSSRCHDKRLGNHQDNKLYLESN